MPEKYTIHAMKRETGEVVLVDVFPDWLGGIFVVPGNQEAGETKLWMSRDVFHMYYNRIESLEKKENDPGDEDERCFNYVLGEQAKKEKLNRRLEEAVKLLVDSGYRVTKK